MREGGFAIEKPQSPSFPWKEVPEGAEAHSLSELKRNGKQPCSRFVIPSAAEGSFSFPVSVFLRKAFCMKHRTSKPQGVRCFPFSLSSQHFSDRKRKRFLAFARNDDVWEGGFAIGKAALSRLPPEGGAPKGWRLAPAIG